MLKIAVFGTGGVGGIFGGLFARAGHTVHFIARGAHYEEIRAKGLRVETPQGQFLISPTTSASQVSQDAQEAAKQSGPFDLVLVCVKAWDLPKAAQAIRPLVGPKTVILPLQNGLEATEILLRHYPQEQVLRGFCAVMSYVAAPGVIRQVGKLPFLCLGELSPPHVSSRIQKLNQELAVEGITLVTPENLLAQQWQKFIFISSLAAVTSASRLPSGPLLQVPETKNLLKRAFEEVVALGKASAAPVLDRAADLAMKSVEEMPYEGTTSMQRDFQAGRRTELETFSGYVLREARKLGVPTPIHEFCYAILLPHELIAQKLISGPG